MANFNYLDFIKIPGPTDTKLSLKDKNNNIIWTISPFKIEFSIIQNNNIKIIFDNSDFIFIDFNNIAESKIAIKTLETNLEILRNKIPKEINKETKLYVNNLVNSSLIGPTGPRGATGVGSTGNITFFESTISTININEDINLQTKGSGEFSLSDNNSHINAKILGYDGWGYGKQGDFSLSNNLLIRGAIYLDPYKQDRDNNYGWTLLTPGTYSVIDSFSTYMRSAKYLVSCDAVIDYRHSMTCEITVANSSYSLIKPKINVYGLISTTASQLATFDIRRKENDDSIVELIAYTDYNSNYITLFRQYIIYPND